MLCLGKFFLFFSLCIIASIYSCSSIEEESIKLESTTLEKASCGQFFGYARNLPRLLRYKLQAPSPLPVYIRSLRQYEAFDFRSKTIIELNELKYRQNTNNPPLKGLSRITDWSDLAIKYGSPTQETNYSSVSSFLLDTYDKFLEIEARYPYECENVLTFIENRFMNHYLLSLELCDMKGLGLEDNKIVEEAKVFLRNPKEKFIEMFLSNPLYMGEFYRLNQFTTNNSTTTYTDLEKRLRRLIPEVKIIQNNLTSSNITFE